MRLRFQRCFSHDRDTKIIMPGAFLAKIQAWAETIELADLGENNFQIMLITL